MDTLVVFYLRLFRQYSRDDSLVELREVVSFIKNNVRPRMPVKFAAILCNKVLGKFSLPSHMDNVPSKSHIEIVFQVLMDDEITGLECPSEILAALQPDDVVRIRGISKLRLHDPICHGLGELRLEQLTVFEYTDSQCTDSDLAILSQHCPKLKHVDVLNSKLITDVGLCALASCSDLVFLKVSLCPNISLSGLKHFLSINKSIRELFAWSANYDVGFDFSNDPNWDEDPSVYLSITSFTIGRCFLNSHLLSVVSKFPNLRSVKLYESFEGDMSALKSLSNLSRIDFDASIRSSGGKFESLLEIVGPQIEHSVLGFPDSSILQRAVNSMFQRCQNLESLTLDCGSYIYIYQMKTTRMKSD